MWEKKRLNKLCTRINKLFFTGCRFWFFAHAKMWNRLHNPKWSRKSNHQVAGKPDKTPGTITITLFGNCQNLYEIQAHKMCELTHTAGRLSLLRRSRCVLVVAVMQYILNLWWSLAPESKTTESKPKDAKLPTKFWRDTAMSGDRFSYTNFTIRWQTVY